MKKSVFIISFDCEGKWGLADCITDYECNLLTNDYLNSAYQRLIGILDKYSLKATFAFVGAFTMSLDEYKANEEWFHDVYINEKSWLSKFKQNLKDNCYNGWLNPGSFEIVRQARQHEIASHGFTHLPLSERFISEEAFLGEMDSIAKLSQLKNLAFHTFVYPRNIIGYPHLLRAAGFVGYRNGLYGKQLGRVRALLNEVNIFQLAHPHGICEDGLIQIPSACFLNWRVGFRKMIPISVTLRKWHHMIDDGLRKNAVIHLYVHPQDFIDGANQYQLLEEILSVISRKHKSGEILNMTMGEYSQAMLNQS